MPISLRATIGRFALAAIAGTATIGGSSPALALLSCSFSITAVDFGTINLTSAANINATGTLSITCTGGNPNSTARICPNINAGSGGTTAGDPRFLLSGATSLKYNLYSNSARTTVWGSYLWGFAPTPPTINVALDATGSGSASRTIYARVTAGQQAVPPGTYTSTFAGSDTQIAYAQSTVGSCAVIGATNATSAPFTVTASYPAICSIASTAHGFGTAGVLNVAHAGTSTVTATCSATTPYTISLDGGTSGASDPTQRQMKKNTKKITYGLYLDSAHTQPWGSTSGVNTQGGTGSGLGQPYTVYGLVPPQVTPAPANYSDTVVATITY
jgi:spore coat protein U-like protein